MRFELYAGITESILPNRSDWRSYPSASNRETLWFHAASAGELEILLPLIQASASAGKPTAVSIFSSSAESWLQRLPEGLVFRGFSPSEKEWGMAFQYFGVKEVITSKYEAWPGLWKAASEQSIRISVVCAQPRSSLRWAKRILLWMGITLPQLRFFVLDESCISELKQDFPSAECVVSSDPRWLRVHQRSESAHSSEKLSRWKSAFANSPRPYWVIGSAWPEDMRILDPAIRNFPGTVLVVPHSLKEKPDLTIYSPHSQCILVDEMGMLVELYSIADRAWVGGGFGKGIHSTLEPSVFGIPVACGPKNVDRFHETHELRQSNQLTVCESSEKALDWSSSSSHKFDPGIKLKLEQIEKLIRSILQ